MPPNCGGRYPWAKGCREYFSADVVTAVDISMDGGTPFDTIPAPIAATREARLVFPILSLGRMIGRHFVQIQEAGLARVTLFGNHHPHAHRLRLVGEQLQKFRVWDLDKLLVVLFSPIPPAFS